MAIDSTVLTRHDTGHESRLMSYGSSYLDDSQTQRSLHTGQCTVGNTYTIHPGDVRSYGATWMRMPHQPSRLKPDHHTSYLCMMNQPRSEAHTRNSVMRPVAVPILSSHARPPKRRDTLRARRVNILGALYAPSAPLFTRLE